MNLKDALNKAGPPFPRDVRFTLLAP